LAKAGVVDKRVFGRDDLLRAFDAIGAAAVANHATIDLAIYGGSALLVASNFRAATEDVDIAEIGQSWPSWLTDTVCRIGVENNWSPDWLNDAVQFHLSPIADREIDHYEFGSFPDAGAHGLRVFVPTLDYMLALKLKAMRINDPQKGIQEAADIQNLLVAGKVETPDEAIAILGRFFPKTAREPDMQRFFLKHIWPNQEIHDGAPIYPIRSR
jgi:hypothetical protein